MQTHPQNQTSKPEHLFIRNPYSNKLVNVLPLFKLMDESFGIGTNGPEDLRERIQMVHDFVSTAYSDSNNEGVDFQEMTSISYMLVRFRKAFEQMQEVAG